MISLLIIDVKRFRGFALQRRTQQLCCIAQLLFFSVKLGPDLFYKKSKGGGLKRDPFYITLKNFGILLTAIRFETLNAVLHRIFSRDVSKLF